MAYEAEITRDKSGCFLFLIDQSGSMADRIAGKRGGKTKAQGVADAINDLLNDLVIKCTGPDGVRDYFDVGVISYAEKVESAFTGVLANRDLVPLSEVAKYRSGGMLKEKAGLPISFGPVAKGDTRMCAALQRAYEVLGDWVRRHPASYPPIVINITDGDATDGNPTEPARHLASLSTKDGNVLIFNCHISAKKGKPILFPRDAKAVPAYGPRLFQMSSILPPKFREVAKNLGFDVVDDTRGFAFNAELTDLIKFLDLGKRTLLAHVVAMDITPTPAPIPTPAPASVIVSPAEDYSPIQTQHTFVAQVKATDGSLVSGASVEWILNRASGSVGDIVSLDGSKPQKVDNTYGVVKTDDKGEARLTITSAREGDIDVTAYVPGISDPAAHKQFAVEHCLDLTAHFPSDAENAIGTNHVLTVQTVKVSDGTPVGNVPVRWTIVGNKPKASFKEAVPSSTTYTIKTDPYGLAAVTLQQVAPAQGTNTVRIEILAPSNPNFVVLTKEVTKKWLATKLGLTKTCPEQIPMLGQTTYDIKLENTGDLAATGVVLTDEIPAGMSYVSSDPAGKVEGRKVSWKVGSLNIAESRSFKLVLQGTQAGLWTNTVAATSKEVGTAAGQASTRVLPAPEVVIKKTGPSGVFTDFTRTYTLAVTNTGAVALNDVVVTDYLPELLSYKSAIPAAGSVAGNKVTWNLGTLNIGETKQIVAILSGVKSGAAVNKATVTTREGVSATDSLNITVLGAPGAHMSLESSGPVPVGDQFTYTIKVVNQSTSNDLHNMTIVGLVPGEMVVYVSADGPTPFKVVGQEVRFGPVAALKPKDTIEFHIKVKATAAGAVVFNATMRWDEFGEPIVNQEGTTVFLPRK